MLKPMHFNKAPRDQENFLRVTSKCTKVTCKHCLRWMAGERRVLRFARFKHVPTSYEKRIARRILKLSSLPGWRLV